MMTYKLQLKDFDNFPLNVYAAGLNQCLFGFNNTGTSTQIDKDIVARFDGTVHIEDKGNRTIDNSTIFPVFTNCFEGGALSLMIFP